MSIINILKKASGTIAIVAVANIASSISSSGAGEDTDKEENDYSRSKQRYWILINLYQEILLLPMLGTYIGDDFHFYITEFAFVLFDFHFLKFAPVPVLESGPSIINQIDYEQPDELFNDNEFESGSAFFNCFQILKILLLVFLINLGYLIYR